MNSDIIIGTDVIGRTHPALKNIIGTFVNILPLRMQVKADFSFKEFLNQVKEDVLDAFENQDFQFDQMVSILAMDEKMSKNPIVNVHFSFSNTVEMVTELSEFESFPIESRRDEISQYDFKLEVRERKSQLDIAFIYTGALFDNETIELLMDYYFNILLSVLESNMINIENIDMEKSLKLK